MIKKLLVVGCLVQCVSEINSADLEVASLLQFKGFDDSNKKYMQGKHQIIYYVLNKFEKHIKKLKYEKRIPKYMRLSADNKVNYEQNRRASAYIVTVKNIITSELCRAFGKINPYKSFRYGENKMLIGDQTDTEMGYKEITQCTASELNYYVLCNYLDNAINNDCINKKTTKAILEDVEKGLVDVLRLSEEMKDCIKYAAYQIQQYIEIFKLDEFIKANIDNAQEINKAHEDANYNDNITDEFVNKYDLRKLAGVHYGIQNHGETCNMVSYLTMLKASRHINKSLENNNTYLKLAEKKEQLKQCEEALKDAKKGSNKQDLENTKKALEEEIDKIIGLNPCIALKALFDDMDDDKVKNTGKDALIGQVTVQDCSIFKKFVTILNGYTYFGDDIKTGENIADKDEENWKKIKKSLYYTSEQIDMDETRIKLIENLLKHENSIKVGEARDKNQHANEQYTTLLADIKEITKACSASSVSKTQLNDLITNIRAAKEKIEFIATNSNCVTKNFGVTIDDKICCFDVGGTKLKHCNDFVDGDVSLAEKVAYCTKVSKRKESGIGIELKQENQSIQEMLRYKDKQYGYNINTYKQGSAFRYCNTCKAERDIVNAELCTARNVLIVQRLEKNKGIDDQGNVLEPHYTEDENKPGTYIAENAPKKVNAEKYIEFNGSLYVRRAGTINVGSHFICIYTGEDGGEYCQSDDLVAEAKPHPQNGKNYYKYELCEKYCGDEKITLPRYNEYINQLKLDNVDDLYSMCEYWLYDRVDW